MKIKIVPLLAAALFVCAVAGQSAIAASLGDYRHLVLNGHTLKWGTPTFGAGAVTTYAVVDRERSFADARNCGTIDSLDGILAADGISRDVFTRELTAAFDAWEQAANINFVRVAPDTADILIGAQVKPRGRAFTNVEYHPFETVVGTFGNTRVNSISTAVICLNPEQPWKVGFDGDLNVYDLGYTLKHEIGHAIGLDHPGSDGALMGFAYQEAFDELQTGDIAGIVSLYGPAQILQATRVEVDAPILPASVINTAR